MIPKIIHQTAPSDKNNWHNIWFKCQKSWQNHFNDFEYRMWDDKEIDELVRVSYPDYWKMYTDFPVHIMKIDFIRFCFMHKFGGIYADMDFFCYQNFYNDLTEQVYLVENPYGNDPIENSLMASEPGNPFWIECMELAKERYYELKNTSRSKWLDDTKIISTNKDFGLKLRPMIIFYITGTNHLSSAFRKTKQKVDTLDGRYYNNSDASYHPSFKTKHVHTGLWGKESIEVFFSNEKYRNTLRNIPVDKFDFYFDYSNGNFLKQPFDDFDKNNTDNSISLDCKYNFL